ncbi:transcription factor 7-like 1-D [Scophthalmus maximus]|uniref:transcription factor 7-like 1-D n=1 Tax=Scophthalmus maximus TaxID=52904 RepID=UPI0015E113AF|nr:transcription factor 7-like 1-D [Scophthalmus maximus]XP_035475537.1 transcription factor 7-like 1-D [Scophthalmus maximus]XP_035475546.1 transcription factor 7-like 1-D [Scophthalmus maximus]
MESLEEEFERLLARMTWGEVVETATASVEELLGTPQRPPTPTPTPPSPSPPHSPSPSPSPPPAEDGAEPEPFWLQCYLAPIQGHERIAPVGVTNGGVYGLRSTYWAPVAAPQPQKRRVEEEPHIKKPPNAFMVFRAEQRPHIVAELGTGDSSAVNRVLGQRWKSLSKEEQAQYYVVADREKVIHNLMFPDWSARDNYGKKRKRTRTAPTRC